MMDRKEPICAVNIIGIDLVLILRVLGHELLLRSETTTTTPTHIGTHNTLIVLIMYKASEEKDTW